jgi:DnaK suppressor protein
MTDAQTRRFRDALKASGAALENTIWRRDGINIERSADPSDEAQFALERELNVRSLESDSSVLFAIRDALRRMDEGDYGLCQGCDGEISEKRLAAVPWARYCIRCQVQIDQRLEPSERYAA